MASFSGEDEASGGNAICLAVWMPKFQANQKPLGKFLMKFSMRIERVLLTMVFLIICLSFASAVKPFGASAVDVESLVTATPDTPTSVAAQAGNVTELNIFGVSVTQTWQGYFGNVSGSITLEDGAGNAMYNWSVADPEGEVYASRSDSVDWDSIDCFNWANNGTWLENNFSIAVDDVDGVNETFTSANGHDEFFTNNIQFTEGQCMSTKIYDSTGSGVDDHFEEVLLWDGSNVVFTSLLEEGSVDGFDGKDHDFEMLVLEDGHGTDTESTTYYFYVELQ